MDHEDPLAEDGFSKTRARRNWKRYIARKQPERRSAFARLRGSAGSGMTTDEIMALTRGE